MRRICLFERQVAVLWFSILACAGVQAQTELKRPLVVVPAKTVAAGDAGRCSDPSQPCFQNNKDILGGQHTLLNVQDVYVSGNFLSSGGNAPSAGSSAQCLTSDAACSSTSQNADSSVSGILTEVTQGVRFDHSDKLTVLTATQSANAAVIQASTNNGSQTTGPIAFGKTNFPVLGRQYQLYSAAADLNGDGLDEAVIAGETQLVVIDHNLHHGKVLNLSELVVGVAAGPIAGKEQIAVLTTLGPSLAVSLYTVDANLNLVPGATAQVAYDSNSFPLDELFSAGMTAGYFTRLDSLQLVAQYTDQSQNSSIVSIDFDGQGKPFGKSVTMVSSQRYYAKLVAGHFLSTPYDQVVSLLYYQTNQGFGLTYYRFNPDDFSLLADHPYYHLGNTCIYDIAAGGFDKQVPASGSEPATISPLDQVVVAKSDSCGNNGFEISIYNISTTSNANFEVAGTQSYPGPTSPSGASFPFIANLSIAAVDIQGRSLVLGSPTILTLVNHAQPSVIIGAPPMHVDYVDPGNGKPTVINFSAAPDGFNSQFQSASSSGAGQDTQSSNTWSFSATETTKDSISLGDCETGDCASATAKLSAKQAVDGTASKTGTTYGSNSQTFQSLTGLGDELIERQSTLTAYVYPVIGHFVCPSSIPNCTPAQQVQENVQIAGQDSITTLQLSGTDLPSYQPVWMPGNVLSYPGTVGQLEADQNLDGSFQELGEVISGLKTDGSGASVAFVNWAQSNSTQKTSGSSQNYSFDSSLSVNMEVSFEVADLSSKDTLDFADSHGVSNLLTSTTALAASRGLQINRSARFSDPQAYSYVLIPHVYGQTMPPGVVDNAGLNTDVQTFGSLRLGYVAQPLSNDGSTGYVWGTWYNRAIDVGLNQPSKWQVPPATNGPSSDPACLVPAIGSSDEDCAQLGNNSPDEPDADEFRYLRGFFIQSLGAHGANGPQLQQVNDNSVVQLGLRVYNFSTVALPAGATVHARFFAMPSTDSQPPSSGDSVFLGEETTSSLPPFTNSADTPNWTLIPHTLNLAAFPQFSGDYLYFWVYVWAQDATGKLIQDLPLHGITQLPPAAVPGSAAEYKAYATTEEAYGNNMGIYHAPLYVNNPLQVADANALTGIEITGSGARRARVRQGLPDPITVVLHTGSAAIANGLTVLFYDGDPANMGTPFAYKSIPYLKADSDIRLQANFRSGKVGEHRIYVVAGPGTNLLQEVIAETVHVVASSSRRDVDDE